MSRVLSKICLPILFVLLASCGKAPSTFGGGSIGSASCMYVDVSSLKERVLLNVPYVEQLPNYCGPASLEMVFRYYGQKIDQIAIGTEIVGPKGVAADQLAQFSLDMGYEATKQYCGINNLLENINSGNPVLVRVINSARDNGHFMVVTGYDIKEEILYINDPALPEHEEISFHDFDTIWDIKTLGNNNNSSRLMIVITPSKN